VARTRSLALLLVICLALLSVEACGGTGASTSGPSESGQAPVAPVANAMPTVSSEGTTTAAPFVVNKNTPQFFADLIQLKTPIVVVFYASTDPSWVDTSKEIDAVQKVYGNQAEFLRLSLDDSWDMASLDASRAAKALQVTNLAQQLAVRFTPDVVVIDRNADITYTHSGYIDSKTLENELFKALKR
jgi:hypothetical protein